MRKRKLFEVIGMEGSDYNFTLSEKGRGYAEKRFYVCQYAGPAPVSLKSYFEAVRNQKGQVSINRDHLRKTFKDLVLTDNLLDQLGPALISQKSIFLYGPTGCGKTSIASNLDRLFEDLIFVPYALEVDGQIIIVYDPLLHQKVDMEDVVYDQRWVPCRRPCLITGGELEPKMLDLQLEEVTQIYAAPIQMRTNNGILVIDDFGRQAMAPQFFLNRWIVPMDRRIDYLSLKNGAKFEIPFETVVAFSTNLDPNSLADEAFLRRIQNKIFVKQVDEKTFAEIFNRLISKHQIKVESSAIESLINYCKDTGPGELRACYPRDILDIIMSIATYEDTPVVIDSDNLKRAVDLYFAAPQTHVLEH
jgi:predicted ATPase with chaperone activity